MSFSLSESLLPQPPSFQKKKAYEIHKVLGVGTFGKVMVCTAPFRAVRPLVDFAPSAHQHPAICEPVDRIPSEQHGTSLQARSISRSPAQPLARTQVSPRP